MPVSTLSIEKPQYLLLILLIFPAILFIFFRFKKITRATFSSDSQSASSVLKSLKRSLFARTLFRCLAWIFVVLTMSEISFGSKKIPVTKSGSNVTFVFDISYSMLAKDVQTTLQGSKKRISRLEAVQLYTSSLLDEISTSSFSAVLAKGDGFLAIPETEDSGTMKNMIENLAPQLMTSSGSSLGKAIDAAVAAIPQHSAKSQYIWVFTDGDETDSRLEKSLENAAAFGIPVTLVGFGSEKETEITAGDGKTRVKTALRSKKMQELSENANRRTYQKITNQGSSVTYVDSRENGSAWKLLNQIKSNSHAEDESTLAYEVRKVNQHTLFTFLAVLCLILSFVFAEFHLSEIKKFKQILAATALFASVFAFTSCSSDKKQILDGVWAWHEGKYTTATADFLNTASRAQKDSLAQNYAVFDLSATYLAMNELDSSLDRLSQLNLEDEKLPKDLRSAAFYNKGKIYEQKGEYSEAAKCFKQAILADSRNVNAKINLELCERELVQKQARNAEAEMQGVNEEKDPLSSMESELFNLIRQNEGKKWKNMQQSEDKNDSTIDY